MTAKELELVKAYKEYIHFLSEAYDDVIRLAWVHGYNCTEKEIEFGQQLRNNIQDIEKECGINIGDFSDPQDF